MKPISTFIHSFLIACIGIIPLVGPSSANAQVTVSSSADTVCAGTMITLTATGADNYVWSPSTNLDTTGGAIVTGWTSTGDTTTQFTVIGEDTAGGTFDTTTITITNITPLISYNIVTSADAENQTICIDSSATIDITGAGGNYIYSWSPSTGLNTTVGMNVVADPTTTTTYTVTASDTATGCTLDQDVTITVNSTPPTLITDADSAAFCEGGSRLLEAGGANTYTWSPGATLNMTTGSAVTATPSVTTTYTVVGRKDGCTSSADITITVVPAPSITFTQSSNGNAICLDESDVITLTTPATNFVWTLPSGQLNTTNKVISVSPDETSTITVVGTDTNGCSNSISILVTVDSCYLVPPPPTGIEGAELNDLLNAYSNSASNEFRVEMDDFATGQFQINIFNIVGTRVYSEQINKASGSTIHNIPTSNLAPGVYILNVSTGNEVFSKRLVKR